MDELAELKKKFSILRQKARKGDIFQSLGSVISEELAALSPQKATPVILPDNDDHALERFQMYSQQLDTHQDDGTRPLTISDEDLRLAVVQLANPLPEYRDTGAFFFLSDSIQNELVSDTQLRWLTMHLVSDEQLFSHILEPENDAVYGRSFSILVLSLLLFTQRTKRSFMSVDQLDIVIDQMALYTSLERDTRGFIGTNGWAHAFTHMGNALAEIFMMPQLMRADKLFLLASMLAGYRELKKPLMMGETERLVEVVMYVANAHELYVDYILLTLKLWRKDLVTRHALKAEAQWHQLYNRSRFFNEIILCGSQNVPKKLYDYVDQTKGYLT
ncbi:DUF2785 domain-containing protein [Leuconostoc sp. MS02]|uniref:DUF2785 domain-containing protein n=1 Tax=Leuconostoc aquikimchii TaxID=3236804 RepID=A0ABV3S201_9LACO